MAVQSSAPQTEANAHPTTAAAPPRSSARKGVQINDLGGAGIVTLFWCIADLTSLAQEGWGRPTGRGIVPSSEPESAGRKARAMPEGARGRDAIVEGAELAQPTRLIGAPPGYKMSIVQLADTLDASGVKRLLADESLRPSDLDAWRSELTTEGVS